MVSYQIFTRTALSTVATFVPVLASSISSGVDLAVFIFSFAWMFVLSAIISSLMFGKERRVSVQFLVSLGLTLLGSGLLELFKGAGLDLSNPGVLTFPLAGLFGNSLFAIFYLMLPFIFMIVIDLRSIVKRKK